MKKILFFLAIAVGPSGIFAQTNTATTEAPGETYVCSQELSAFGRPGEIETNTYKRVGEFFVKADALGNEIRYPTMYESASELVLVKLIAGDGSPASVSVILINKDTLEWGGEFVSMEYLQSDEERRMYARNYGECVVVE